MSKNISVYGIFRSLGDLKQCLEGLEKSGFRNTDLAVLYHENMGSKDFAHEKHTKAPEGAALGAAIGLVLGGLAGWMLGQGWIGAPQLSELFASVHPAIGALSGAGAIGALGAIIGALVGLGVPEYEAKRYMGRVRNGGHLISVHCDDGRWATSAQKIIRQMGGQFISKAGEASADYAQADRPAPRP